MFSKTRKVDTKSRVILPELFAGRLVTVEQLGEGELRIRLTKAPRPRPSFHQLMAAMADADLPEKVDIGPPVGRELL